MLDGNRQTRVWLERVSIFGAKKPTKITLAGDNEQQLQFKFDQDTKQLVIRKPGASMAQNWQINITY